MRALDDYGAEPLHVGKFGRQIDAQGVTTGFQGADRCIGYLTEYLVKDALDLPDRAAGHVARRDRRTSAPEPPWGRLRGNWPMRHQRHQMTTSALCVTPKVICGW